MYSLWCSNFGPGACTAIFERSAEFQEEMGHEGGGGGGGILMSHALCCSVTQIDCSRECWCAFIFMRLKHPMFVEQVLENGLDVNSEC